MGQTVQGAMLVYPKGGCGDPLFHLFAHLLVCVSQECYELVVQEPSCILHVRWHGEAMCGLRVQGVRIVLLLVAFQARCVSSISTSLLLYRAHAICVLCLVAIFYLLRSFDSVFLVVFIYTGIF
jgi:hypothetical protein